MTLPRRPYNVLVAYRTRRIWTLGLLGFGSAVPNHFLTSTLLTWLVYEDVPVAAIGVLSMTTLPFSVKFLWAPLLDRWSLPFLGRRRGWMLLGQLLVAAAIACFALVPAHAFVAVFALALATAVFSATHDTVVDAHRADVAPPAERGDAATMYVASYRIALLGTGALGIWAATRTSWELAFVIIAAFLLVGVAGTLLAPEAEVPPDAPKTFRQAFTGPFVELFTRPATLVVVPFIILYKIGEYIAAPMMTPLYKHLGITLLANVTIWGVVMAATFVGFLVAAVLIPRLGVKRSLIAFGIAQGGANVGYALCAAFEGDIYAVAVAAAIDNVANGMGAAAFVAYLMSLTNRAFSATQYALLICLVGFLGRIVGGTSGMVAESTGFTIFFAATALLAAPGIVLAFWLPREEVSPS